MKSQRDAVYDAVVLFLASRNESINGRKVELSTEERVAVNQTLAKSLHDGEYIFNAKDKYDSLEKVEGYSIRLLSNWLRRDTRLNGGVKHVIKNVGSRLHAKDTIVKKLRSLRRKLSDLREIEIVDAEISNRVRALKGSV